ncbi:MAG: crossover junction endodeoxyribonuclease RuvC [Gemmatimonadota bacterium]|nr:MAG: crossover junction endodeoxyribonuclease RuvC [Gemmatimonadota bacterium]
MRVLGVDPGTSVTGYGVIEPTTNRPGRLIECGVIRTSSREHMSCRLEHLYDGIRDLIERHRPTALAVESVFYGKNVKTTIALGQVRGVVLLAGAQAGLEVAEFPPATVKKSVVGEGGAMKEQVGFMVQQLLRLKEPPKPDDAADACAIALTYLLSSKVRA